MTPAVFHPADLDRDALLAECEVRRVRRSGPGGQRRNKVETGTVLRHRPTGIHVEASERRSQAENLAEGVRRLRLALAIGVRRRRASSSEDEPDVLGAVPSPLWRSRCAGGGVSVNPRHEDFPSMLAEALDVLAAESGEVRRAAGRLGCTASQLVKFLKREPRAFAQVNEERRQGGLSVLK